MGERRRLTREFKLEAVRLLQLAEKPAAQVARELGLPRNRLYKWRQEVALKGEAAFRGAGRKAGGAESEIARLKCELARVTEERDILKKAAKFFKSRKP
jgi:transposase